MRVDTERRHISIAGFLLCLLGIYAISPIDYFLRTSVGSRSRAVRTCRLDDHDHQDHALDAASLIATSFANHGSDGGGMEPAVEIAGTAQPFPVVAADVPEYFPSSIRPVFLNASRGRAPPSLS